ncbi:glycoside hydrolase family 16 protein [Granulosicoccus antarcticus]|uniref:Endo-1,3-1,4-beta-glycanase ExsH n=1 Tax=Granulosicoccus antarcticus IMCC3135 TaxID=1192854 RepID=A0A2Z2NS34_9GAMM|nr:glycoside hydrolase family 16 protein [Granulosicoccus antarcticus]ASJ72538.1 Endo-1,3-1,4-beta-glycanase ExsH [Granulosicoccus antarcticus IMCC3135]
MKKMTHKHLFLLASLAGFSGTTLAQSEKMPLDDACWNVSFEEPFDKLSLWSEANPEGIWRTQYIWSRETIINDEQQFYIDPQQHGVSPFSIDDGILSITASVTPRALRGVVEGQPYVSGVLTTEKNFSQQYGRFEVRAQLPAGQGLWSAFWLLPSFDQWPEGVAVLPEIDVMENLGHQPNTYHTTLHTNETGELTSFPFDHTMKSDLTKDFHLYSVVWTPESVNWYLDGQWKASSPTPGDYTRPVHFLLNLAVGGTWPGSPDATTEFPASFNIDYVRAWTHNDSCSS